MKVKETTKVPNVRGFVVYVASHEGEVYYVGNGVLGREKHVNSGCSHVYHLNRMHFEGVTFDVKVEKYTSKEEAVIREKDLIRFMKPKFNKVFMEETTLKLQAYGVLKTFILEKAADFRRYNLCTRNDQSDIKLLMDTIPIISLTNGFPVKYIPKPINRKVEAIIRKLSGSQSGCLEFINYFYSTEKEDSRVIKLSDLVLENFVQFLEEDRPHLLTTFLGSLDIIPAQMKDHYENHTKQLNS